MMMMMVVVVVGDVLMSWPSAKDIQSLKWIINIFPLILNIWEGGRDDIRGSPSTQEKEGEQASVSFSAGDFFLRISGCRMSVSRVQSAASIITSSDDNLSDCILVAGAMSPALAVRQEVEDISRSKVRSPVSQTVSQVILYHWVWAD